MRRVIKQSGSIQQRTYWMLLAVVTLIFAFGWGRVDVAPAQAEFASASVGAGGLISHFSEDPTSKQTRVILIDPQLRRMAVYDVLGDNGAIQLKSVRNLTVDLQVQAYNSEDPSPIDMQKMLERN